MKIKTKLFLGFLSVILIAVAIGVFLIFCLFRVSQVINQELPPVVQDLSKTSYLNNLAQFIHYYDEVLTQSARNYAFTGDIKWKDRYFTVVTDLDKKIKEAIAKGSKDDKLSFQAIDQSNLALVALEEKAFALVDAGKAQEAVVLLESEEYWQQKGIYSQGLSSYLSRRGQLYEQTFSVSTENLSTALSKVQSTVTASMTIFFAGMIIGIIIVLLVSWLIIRFLSSSLLEFKAATEEIAQGNIDKRVVINSKDEFSDLAISFNKMADKLKDSIINTEKKVKQRTAELEKINKTMVGRELKMVELKKEINELKNNK